MYLLIMENGEMAQYRELEEGMVQGVEERVCDVIQYDKDQKIYKSMRVTDGGMVWLPIKIR